MNVFTIEDRTGEIKCVAFPKDKIKNEDKIVEGKIVIVNGTIQDNERGLQIIVKTMIDVDAMRLSEIPDILWLRGAKNKLWARKQWIEAQNLVTKNPGDVTVHFLFGQEKYQMNGGIELNLSNICAIQEIMGESNVKIMFKK